MDLEKFRRRLKDLRESNDLYQVDLAKRVNVSQSTVAKWENGMRLPDITQLYKLCEVYNVSADYLLGFSDF